MQFLKFIKSIWGCEANNEYGIPNSVNKKQMLFCIYLYLQRLEENNLLHSIKTAYTCTQKFHASCCIYSRKNNIVLES